MIDRATIQRIMDATDIVDVVKEFVTLRKAGVNYKGLCPFHNEKTPSFTVSPSKQLCKCFSCGKGGNAVNFLMQLEQMTYPEALKWLGKKYGIEVKEKELTDEEKVQQNERESMFAVNEWVNSYFQDNLHNNVDGVAIGMAYFRQRGFRDEVIRKFQLGFALGQRNALALAAKKHGFNEEYLVSTGVCYKTEDGRLQDRYCGRVIFPVFSVSGKIVAFGGRILGTDKKAAKYVNSPESIIYSKSRELYGLFQAKSSIIRQDCCFLVEGYTDVISMHQSGIENVVASSGTSLTEGQIRLLHRFTNNITVLYDGDAAGIKASIRGIDMLLAEGMNIKVLPLPYGEDPDSFARTHKAEEFIQYIQANQTDFIKFKTNLLIEDAKNDPIKRAEMITDVVKSISVIPDQIVRQMYINECATMLQVSEALIVSEINKLIRKLKSNDEKAENQNNSAAETTKEVTDDIRKIDGLSEENLLISMIIKYGNYPIGINKKSLMNSGILDDTDMLHATDDLNGNISVAEYINQEFTQDGLAFSNELFKQILDEAVKLSQESSQWEAYPYFIQHPNVHVSSLAAEVGEENFVLSSKQREQYIDDKYRLEEVVPRILHDFKHSIIKNKLDDILVQLRNPSIMSSPELYQNLMKEYMEISSVERKLAQILGDRVILK